MNDRDIAAIKKALIEIVEKIERPLHSLDTVAVLKLVDEFYSKDERKKLYEKYGELVAAQEVDSPAMQNNSDQRSNKATVSHDAIRQVKEFQREHPLIVRIMDKVGEMTRL